MAKEGGGEREQKRREKGANGTRTGEEEKGIGWGHRKKERIEDGVIGRGKVREGKVQRKIEMLKMEVTKERRRKQRR